MTKELTVIFNNEGGELDRVTLPADDEGYVALEALATECNWRFCAEDNLCIIDPNDEE